MSKSVPKKKILDVGDYKNTEDYYLDAEDEDEIRICDTTCPHYDGLNLCCWQSGKWGLCFDIQQYDECHLGYTENDPR